MGRSLGREPRVIDDGGRTRIDGRQPDARAGADWSGLPARGPHGTAARAGVPGQERLAFDGPKNSISAMATCLSAEAACDESTVKRTFVTSPTPNGRRWPPAP